MSAVYRGLALTSILSSLLTVSCGDVDLPDSGLSRGVSGDGQGVKASSELTLDLEKCGFDLSKPGANLSSRRMAMVPKSMVVNTKLLGGLFTTQTNVTIAGMSIIEESLSRSVATFSAQATPATESEEVSASLKSLTSGFTADLLTTAERSKIGETYADWKGIFCSLQPAMRIERGLTEKIIAEFDKPLPVSPLMMASIARMKSEIGVKRSWSGITAKVIESSDPNVPNGSSWTGRVLSQPVKASIEVDGPSGKVSINADLAVKMTYDFGSAQSNAALGLPSSVIWYIDSATKSFKLTQMDFGDGVVVNYLPDR